MTTQNPIITRYKKNPILTKDDVPYPVSTVHNAGIVKHNGRYIMLFRSHRHNGRSIIGRADSDDGFSFIVRPEPFLSPAMNTVFAEYEEFGVEDLRICPVEGEYLLSYSAYSRHGVRIALARTTDFEDVERIALITQADLRNVVIFPVKFGGRYVRLDRPHSEISPWSIWITYSPDLRFWGESQLVMKPHGSADRQAVTGRGRRGCQGNAPKPPIQGNSNGIARPIEPVLTAQSSPESLCQGF